MITYLPTDYIANWIDEHHGEVYRCYQRVDDIYSYVLLYMRDGRFYIASADDLFDVGFYKRTVFGSIVRQYDVKSADLELYSLYSDANGWAEEQAFPWGDDDVLMKRTLIKEVLKIQEPNRK